jgi:putative methanogenesis marker 16 metalloprotein
MSGTLAIMMVPVGPKNVFERAERAWLNGVPAYPGPCPNERLGVVDLIVYGTAYRDHHYGGGHLFRDLVEGKSVYAEIEAEGKRFGQDVTLEEMGFARIMTTRSAFRNYPALIHRSDGTIPTIFSVRGLRGPDREVSVSGCGDINPIENDPDLRTIGIGTKILLNGAVGYIMGEGTRSSRERPNLAAFADMKGMDPRMLGGMKTSHTPECLTSLAIPIPVLDNEVLGNLLITNERIPVPITDVKGRIPCGGATYAEVWGGTDSRVQNDPSRCIRCGECPAEAECPTGAITRDFVIDRSRCINCGTCVQLCPAGAFTANLGNLTFCNAKVPITLRQSDRVRAEELCERLKTRILEGAFLLSEKSGEIR